MITNLSWIGAVDHRISAAIVFFILLLLLSTGKKRRFFPLRAGLTLMVMVLASWGLRTLSDEMITDIRIQGLCYSAQIMAMHLLFLGGSFFCYRENNAVMLYNGLLGLTIFKIAWNTFKTGSSLLLINNVEAPWGQYSIAGSLVSYLVYFGVCLALFFLYRYLVKDPPYHAPARLMTGLTMVFVPLQMVLEFCGHVFTAERAALFLYYLCALLYTVLNYAALLMIAQLDSFRHENRTMHDFISNKMRYYEMSHDGIVQLQTKCHDLKHQIHAIRSEAGKARFDEYLNELEDSINEYSTVIECGNPTVDIVLTEKNILCYSSKVKFSYMIDGAMFNFSHRAGDLFPVRKRPGQRAGGRDQDRGPHPADDHPEKQQAGQHGGAPGGEYLRGGYDPVGQCPAPHHQNRFRPWLRPALHQPHRGEARRRDEPAHRGRSVQAERGYAGRIRRQDSGCRPFFRSRRFFVVNRHICTLRLNQRRSCQTPFSLPGIML